VTGLVDALWGKESAVGKKQIKRSQGWLLKDQDARVIAQPKAALAGGARP